MMYLLENEDIKMNKATNENETALSIATAYNYKKIVDIFKEQDAK